MKSVPEFAEELAKAHVEDDPKTTDVYFVEGVDNEVRLVEVSGSLAMQAQARCCRFDSRHNPRKASRTRRSLCC